MDNVNIEFPRPSYQVWCGDRPPFYYDAFRKGDRATGDDLFEVERELGVKREPKRIASDVANIIEVWGYRIRFTVSIYTFIH